MFMGQHAVQKYGTICLAARAMESLHAVPDFTLLDDVPVAFAVLMNFFPATFRAVDRYRQI